MRLMNYNYAWKTFFGVHLVSRIYYGPRVCRVCRVYWAKSISRLCNNGGLVRLLHLPRLLLSQPAAKATLFQPESRLQSRKPLPVAKATPSREIVLSQENRANSYHNNFICSTCIQIFPTSGHFVWNASTDSVNGSSVIKELSPLHWWSRRGQQGSHQWKRVNASKVKG